MILNETKPAVASYEAWSRHRPQRVSKHTFTWFSMKQNLLVLLYEVSGRHRPLHTSKARVDMILNKQKVKNRTLYDDGKGETCASRRGIQFLFQLRQLSRFRASQRNTYCIITIYEFTLFVHHLLNTVYNWTLFLLFVLSASLWYFVNSIYFVLEEKLY